MKWRALSYSPDDLFHWDDEFVAFNKLSGDTHLLSAFAGQILLKLQQTSFDAASLAHLFAPSLKINSEQDLELQIKDILDELYLLTLIEHT